MPARRMVRVEKSEGTPLRVFRRVDACPTKFHGGSISQIYETWGCEKRRRSQQVATLPYGEPPSWRRNRRGRCRSANGCDPGVASTRKMRVVLVARSRRSATLPQEDGEVRGRNKLRPSRILCPPSSVICPTLTKYDTIHAPAKN